MFLLLGTSLKCLSLPEDLLLPFDAQQVLPPPPNPPTIHFLAHTYAFSCQAHSPALHILEVFLVRAGTATQKGSFPPAPWFLCCFALPPIPPDPPAPPLPRYLLAFTLKFLLRTLTLPFLFFF